MVIEKVDLFKSWENSQDRESTGLLSICKHGALLQLIAGTLGGRTVCVAVTKDKAQNEVRSSDVQTQGLSLLVLLTQ